MTMNNKNEIINKVSRTFYKLGLQLKKHSPEILTTAGTVGVVASTVIACKATTKVSGILEEAKTNIDQVHNVLEDENISEETYSIEDSKKDLAIIYVQTGVKLAKLYGPAIVLGVCSLGCIFSSHRILSKRNIALAAAYSSVDKGFKEYRNRVIDRFGKDIDRELRYNVKAKEIEETIIDKDGTEKKVKKIVETVNPTEISDYARFFDDGCEGWKKDSELNLLFLKAQQHYANNLLVARGYLFLNEVYDMLGIPKTSAGQVVGWVYDPEGEKSDAYVDFGIYNIYNEKARDFVNGYERTILLDFNVDGPILDKAFSD